MSGNTIIEIEFGTRVLRLVGIADGAGDPLVLLQHGRKGAYWRMEKATALATGTQGQAELLAMGLLEATGSRFALVCGTCGDEPGECQCDGEPVNSMDEPLD